MVPIKTSQAEIYCTVCLNKLGIRIKVTLLYHLMSGYLRVPKPDVLADVFTVFLHLTISIFLSAHTHTQFMKTGHPMQTTARLIITRRSQVVPLPQRNPVSSVC